MYRNIKSLRSHTRSLVYRSTAVACAYLFLFTSMAHAADPSPIATAALEFGGSTANLLWVTYKTHSNVTKADADRYQKLAYQVKAQIDMGRTSSSLLTTDFNLVGAGLGYATLGDVEPLSKALLGISAWGAKKTGDAIGQYVMSQSEEQARGILAQGLKNSGLSAKQIEAMKPNDLEAKVADFQIGGQKLQDILQDQPKLLDMLKAHAVDLAINMGVANLAKSAGIAEDVSALKKDLIATNKNMEDFQTEVKAHLERVESRIQNVQQAVKDANDKLAALETKVAGNTKAIQTLARISYAGWSTTQKIEAVESGLLSDLNNDQKEALLASLRADKAREDVAASMQQTAKDFGNLAAIASNIGLPGDVVKGLQGAQIAANGIAQFATGDVLGGIASVTSLFGLGAPDAAAQRYAEMMKYLAQEFAQVNKKLDQIIDLQVKTMQAVLALVDEQRQFRREVLGQLDRIENTVLNNELILQAILQSKWTECYALVNGTPLNGQFTMPDQKTLVSVLEDANLSSYAGTCYSTMVSFLDGWVKPANWSGQIISGDSVPTDRIAADADLLKHWKQFQSQRRVIFNTAQDFILAEVGDEAASNTKISPSLHIAAFAQPVSETQYETARDGVLFEKNIQARFSNFKCNETDVLAPALADLMCFHLIPGTAAPPKSDRWSELLKASLLGPQVTRLIDTGIVLATLSDFAEKDHAGVFHFAHPNDVKNFAANGPTPRLSRAVKEGKGQKLLAKLRWLTESMVLQQSVAYGDHTAQLIEQTLYDQTTRSLNTDPVVINSQKKLLALQAMRANPILARNVVMLAMRHAISDALGGADNAEKVRFSQTYYTLALQEFAGPQACEDQGASEKLLELFPQWKFKYYATEDEQKAAYGKCPKELVPDWSSDAPISAPGSGVAVSVADFYVVIPSPLALATGVFEQADSLRLALFYRDRLNQAIVDRNILSVVQAVSSGGADTDNVTASTAFALLNEGWNWQPQKVQ